APTVAVGGSASRSGQPLETLLWRQGRPPRPLVTTERDGSAEGFGFVSPPLPVSKNLCAFRSGSTISTVGGSNILCKTALRGPSLRFLGLASDQFLDGHLKGLGQLVKRVECRVTGWLLQRCDSWPGEAGELGETV